MPFIKCPECGKLNSVKLKTCPKCEASLEMSNNNIGQVGTPVSAWDQNPVQQQPVAQTTMSQSNPWGQPVQQPVQQPVTPPPASGWGQTTPPPVPQQGAWGGGWSQPAPSTVVCLMCQTPVSADAQCCPKCGSPLPKQGVRPSIPTRKNPYQH